MSKKTNSVYPTKLKSTKGLSTWEYKSFHSLCQIKRIKRPLYVSLKQDNLIALLVRRFPDLFGNLNWFIFARRLILWYSKMLVTSYELRIESLKARVKIQKREFKSSSYKFKSTSYKFKSTSYEFKSTS